jgi:hypothetical protein
MTRKIMCVVEGHGEVAALPILLRRIAARQAPNEYVECPRPIRVPRGRLLKADELERAVTLAVRSIAPVGSVLLLLDADDDCPAELGPRLLERIASVRAGVGVSAVLAKTEFEAWFIAAVRSLRGYRGLPEDIEPPPEPESIRGAKEWLSQHQRHRYSETLDQPAFAERMDLDLARSTRSFEKLWRDVGRLLGS